MKEKIEKYLKEVESFNSNDKDKIEEFRIKFLGRKGIMQELFTEFKKVSPEEKKQLGKLLNELKKTTEDKVKSLSEGNERANKKKYNDLTVPPGGTGVGSRHPLSVITDRAIEIFSRIGFNVEKGPDIEDDWHNFTALNIPPEHPARDMQDTFFVEKDPDIVLRTHTSPVQIRTLQNQKPPVRIISPGKVYRCDSDATHSPAFHQIEGIYVDEEVNFADLKQTLFFFVEEMFGKGTDLRFRPSFFPFTEPSAELDIEWKKKDKKDWMEILGCGVVHKDIMENC
ncbi:MAG: phenylalanine--tRNA ligase subunit alpha, partial [Flavobacteriales bacterium]